MASATVRSRAVRKRHTGEVAVPNTGTVNVADSAEIILNQRQHLSGTDVHLYAIDMIQNAEREVLIMVSNFVQGQFDDVDLTAVLSVFARSSRYAQVCILVTSTQRIVPNSHAILRLQQRLSSLVQIRQVLPDDASDLDLLLVDQRHLLKLQLERNGVTAQRIVHAVPHAKQLSDQFLFWWQRAQPITELRRLSL